MAANTQKKTDHKEIQTDSVDIDYDCILKLKHDFSSLSEHMNSLGKVIENLERKVNNEKKLNDLINDSRLENETKAIEAKNIKHNLNYLKEIVALLEEENELVIRKRKLELNLEKELGQLNNNCTRISVPTPAPVPTPVAAPTPPPPPPQNIGNRAGQVSLPKPVQKENEKEDPPRRSMDIQGDLKSALQNRFKNVNTGDDSD